MKRCFTRFKQWVSKKRIEEKIIWSLCVIAGICGIIYYLMSNDLKPATSMDYEPLEKQMYDIQQNPDLLLKTDCKIDTTKGDIIAVEFSNAECGLKVEYDQNFQILFFSRYDKCTFWGEALLFASCLGGMMSIVTFLLIVALGIIFECIHDTFKSKKAQGKTT